MTVKYNNVHIFIPSFINVYRDIHQVYPFSDPRQPCNPAEDTTVQKEASESDNYCALTKQRTDEQESQVYCELRSFDYM